MDDKPIRILLIEDNPGDVRLIREMLAEAATTGFDLVCADRLSTGLERLLQGGIDILLLDLGLPDSQGVDTFTKVHGEAPEVPIIVLTGLDDDVVAVTSVGAGAQDYLVKGQMDSNLLVRSIRYAIQRQRMQAELRALALVDQLTGLHNRRGFLELAQQQLKIANRTKNGMLLLFADFDDLKAINDMFGLSEGDLALTEIAQVFQETFRASDIVARIGGDEFVVLAIDACENSAEALASRLQRNLEVHNAREDRAYELSLSVGTAYYDPESPCSVDELLVRADARMYEQKQRDETHDSRRVAGAMPHNSEVRNGE